jgi:hypothetical protein
MLSAPLWEARDAKSTWSVELEHNEQESEGEESSFEWDESILAALLTSWSFTPLENSVDVHRVPAWDRLLDRTVLDPPEQHA